MSLSSVADVASTAFRWLEYVGLVGFVGVVVVRRLAGMRPPITWARPGTQPTLAVALAGGLGVVIVEALRAGQFSVAVLLLPFTTHAARVNPSWGAIFTDAIHLLSAGAWAGSILVLATLRPPGGWVGEEGRLLLQRFGPVAFLAFAITALTGVVRAAEALGTVNSLWTTPYGLVLSAKIAGVLVMAAMSALLWRRGLSFARIEGIIVLLVLAATAILAGIPTPAYYPIVQLAFH